MQRRVGIARAFSIERDILAMDAHKVTAVEDTVVISCKDVIGGVGHKLAPGETDRLQELGKA